MAFVCAVCVCIHVYMFFMCVVTQLNITCALVQCILAILLAVVDICRSSGQELTKSHQWRCLSSAAPIDMLQRNSGTDCPSWDAWAPYTHLRGCYSTQNRSRNRLAVETDTQTTRFIELFKTTFWSMCTRTQHVLDIFCCISFRISVSIHVLQRLVCLRDLH